MTATYTLQELESTATKVLEQMQTKTLLLHGGLGAGKTTLVKAMVKLLGSHANASSPTFSLVNEYEIADGLAYHFDMYRINQASEALDFGIEDYLYSGHYCFIEWPENIDSLLPQDVDSIYLDINHDNSRSLKLNYSMNLTL